MSRLSQLNNEQINFIASEVVNFLKTDRSPEQHKSEIIAPGPEGQNSGTGIYNDLDSAVQAAKVAQHQLINSSL